ncbi:MAG: hypothetical protein Q4D32_08500 [Eubacteriales bacterium]|nr:hypothetical protein [Eubacteriales bacterium]
MGRKKRKTSDMEMEYLYMQALKGKEIPLLTLDARWHALFPDFRKTSEIKKIEKELNQFIKQQGQVEHDLKDYDNAKKVLMKNIVDNMTDGHEFDSPIRIRKQEKNQKLIADLNEKIEEAGELKRHLPRQIKETNQRLLIACMKVCYQELMDNTEVIEEEEKQIQAMREELKEHILQKQDREMRNTEVYKYMHNLLGAEVVEVFDREHQVWKGNIEETKLDE